MSLWLWWWLLVLVILGTLIVMLSLCSLLIFSSVTAIANCIWYSLSQSAISKCRVWYICSSRSQYWKWVGERVFCVSRFLESCRVGGKHDGPLRVARRHHVSLLGSCHDFPTGRGYVYQGCVCPLQTHTIQLADIMDFTEVSIDIDCCS